MTADATFSGGEPRDALSRRGDIDDMHLQLLFDESNRLIDTSVDELNVDPQFPHPLSDFYEEYTSALLGRGRSVFTPPDAAVPVVPYPAVTAKLLEEGQAVPSFKLLGARRKYRLNPAEQTIGILTAGGNAPGLNVVIDSIVKRHSLLATKSGATQRDDGTIEGVRFWGYHGGYSGLLNDEKTELNVRLTDNASSAPGSVLGIRRGELPTDRAVARGIDKEQAQLEIAADMLRAVQRDKLDMLYLIGGNGTLTAADWLCHQLQQERVTGEHGQPVRVVGIPKTMDNDVHYTDVTFGFRTTVENAVEVIRRMHGEAETCGRIAVVELFGAASGFVALHASYASGEVDHVLIPETMQGPASQKRDVVDAAARRLAERFRKRGHAILVVAEGATTSFDEALGDFQHGGTAARHSAFNSLVTYLKERLAESFTDDEIPLIFTNRPRHLIRSTAPNTSDIDLCKQTGKLAVDAALSGMSRCAVCLWHGDFVAVPLRLAASKRKCVDVGGYYFLTMMEKYLL